MLSELKEQVWAANLRLPEHGPVTVSWGNVWGIDHDRGLVCIKPSGVFYKTFQPGDMAFGGLWKREGGGGVFTAFPGYAHAS